MAIRVAQVCAVDFTVERFLRPLIGFLESKGLEVTTICSPGPAVESLRAKGMRIDTIPTARSYNLISHAKTVGALTAYFRAQKFDLVHVHTPIAALLGRIAARRAGVPIAVYTAHGFYFHDRMPGWLRNAHIALEKFAATRGDYIFTQSAEDRENAIRYGIEKPERITTIGNGIDLKRFSRAAVPDTARESVRREFNFRDTDKIIAVIGRLVPEKGYHELFAAFESVRKTIPEAKLLVIGQALGSDRGGGPEVFRDVIARLGDSVAFAGLRDDVPELLSLANVFTLPSHREGMPRSIIEAMAMQLPVVATNIRGCREEVVEGETGHLVELGDIDDLAAKLIHLLQDDAQAQQFGAAGRRRAEEHYSEADVLQRQWDVYRKLLKLDA